MMPHMMRTCLALVVLVACGGGGGGMNNDMMGDDTPVIDASPDGQPFVPPEGYTRLIGRTWSIAPGGNKPDHYLCTRFTVPTDTYITNIIAQAPPGTHHTVLSIAGANGTGSPGNDNDYDCSVGSLGMVMLYASGVGTSPLDFPQDVGVKVAAGTQIHLNLHLFNASEKTISGESAIWVKSSPTPTPTLAEMVFAGAFGVYIPSNNMDTPITGGCTSNRNFTMFALWPHMHQLANHSKFEIIRGSAQPEILHDKPYTFSEQAYYKQSPEVQVQSGDQIRVTCTYRNNTGSAVTFGDSSNKEMCFTGMYRYPAANAGLFECTDTGGVGF
jgi:hypothetical protein